jgi:hypothetical protein
VKSRRELVSLSESGGLGIPPRVALAKLEEWEQTWGELPPIVEMRVSILDFLGRPVEADALIAAQKDEEEAVASDLETRLAGRERDLVLIPAMKA